MEIVSGFTLILLNNSLVLMEMSDVPNLYQKVSRWMKVHFDILDHRYVAENQRTVEKMPNSTSKRRLVTEAQNIVKRKIWSQEDHA